MLVKSSCSDYLCEGEEKFKQIFYVSLVEDGQDAIYPTVMDTMWLKVQGHHVILDHKLIIVHIPLVETLQLFVSAY